jgi:hypothetical protein
MLLLAVAVKLLLLLLELPCQSSIVVRRRRLRPVTQAVAVPSLAFRHGLP